MFFIFPHSHFKSQDIRIHRIGDSSRSGNTMPSWRNQLHARRTENKKTENN